LNRCHAGLVVLRSQRKDKIVDGIVKWDHFKLFQTDDKAVSVSAVKKILESDYGKTSNAKINVELATLAKKGLIMNTSGTKSASGSYVINPEFENFDTRRSFLAKNLDNVERVIEDVITKVCYDGAPCVDQVLKQV